MSIVADLDDTPFVLHPEPTSFQGLVPQEAPATIELVDLQKSLGGHKVLDGITLRVNRGETMCIMGGSGTGKSVTLKHIVGLMRPDAGRVMIDGELVSDSICPMNGHLDEIRKKIGFLFQGAALLNSLNVFENVALPLREHENPGEEEIRRLVTEKLDLVGLKDASEKMPSVLSGGMKKRVGLARAIIRSPEIILYDEPTAGLDPVTASTINQLILSMQQKLGVTSILVTHDMSSAFRVSNRMAMLYQGKVHKFGTPEEFRASDDPIITQFVYGDSEGPLTRENTK